MLYFLPPGTHFQRLIPDEGPAAVGPQNVKRVVFCTGKIYYDLIRERKSRGLEDAVAVVRIEQVIGSAFASPNRLHLQAWINAAADLKSCLCDVCSCLRSPSTW